MKFDVKKLKFDFNCPSCGSKIKNNLQGMRAGKELHCRACGIDILIKSSNTEKVAREVNRNIGDLGKM